MLLTMGFVGMIVLVLGCGIFLGLAPMKEPASDAPALVVEKKLEAEIPARRFFAQSQTDVMVTTKDLAYRRVPVELLMSELQDHIRREELVAEAFARAPSEKRLHVPVDSNLLH